MYWFENGFIYGNAFWTFYLCYELVRSFRKAFCSHDDIYDKFPKMIVVSYRISSEIRDKRRKEKWLIVFHSFNNNNRCNEACK